MFIIIKRSRLIVLLLLLALGVLLLTVRIPKITPAAGPIFRGDVERKAVAFCINVAWGNEYIPTILEALRKNNCKATFFFIGTWVRDFPDLARSIANEGHEIANHGYFHSHVAKLSKAELHKLILDNDVKLKKELGRATNLFAPPYGEFNDKVVAYAEEIGFKTIMWTIDTIDWRNPTPETYLKRVLEKLQNGALILAHPTEVTAKTLPILINEIKKRGYDILIVSEII